MNSLKNDTTTSTVIAHVEHVRYAFVIIEAPLEALSGILEQSDYNGKRHPIVNATRKLKGDKNTLQLLNIRNVSSSFVVNYCQEYLLDRKVTILNDHDNEKPVFENHWIKTIIWLRKHILGFRDTAADIWLMT